MVRKFHGWPRKNMFHWVLLIVMTKWAMDTILPTKWRANEHQGIRVEHQPVYFFISLGAWFNLTRILQLGGSIINLGLWIFVPNEVAFSLMEIFCCSTTKKKQPPPKKVTKLRFLLDSLALQGPSNDHHFGGIFRNANVWEFLGGSLKTIHCLGW